MSLIDLLEYRDNLLPQDFQILEKAVQHGPVKLKGELVWEDMEKKTLTLLVPESELEGMLSWMVMGSNNVTSPVYQAKQKPGFVRIRINAKQAKEIWTFKRDGSQRGLYEMTVRPAIYLGYQINGKRLQGWYLKLEHVFKYV